MDRKYKVGGYVKLAKLWERSKDAAVAYHSSYYAEKFRDDADKRLVGVYIDITGNKEIYKRPEMVHLLKDCKKGAVNLIFSQTTLIPNEVFKHVHLMVRNIVIIRFSDTVLIGIREEFHLLFLHFTSKRICIFLWLRGEHDCFFQIKQHTKTLI